MACQFKKIFNVLFHPDYVYIIGEKLAQHTPGELNKFMFTLGGAEANENALKFARIYTGRAKILARNKAYHGATHGAMLLTGDQRRWGSEIGASMGSVVRMFDPYQYRSLLYREGMTEEEFSEVMIRQHEETILVENPNNIAAMFLETVTGTNGIIPPPKGYLHGVKKMLEKYGILMVCDEVMCGLGRTGEWFACDHWDFAPDIITMAKGVSSANLPLGVVALSPKVYNHFDDIVFPGGLTYSSHPMCLAASLATIKVYEEEKLIENSRNMGVVLAAHLKRMMEKHICIGDVRSIGLFSAMELVKNRETKEPMATPYGGPDPCIAKLNAFLRSKGLFAFISQNIFHVSPPLTITKVGTI